MAHPSLSVNNQNIIIHLILHIYRRKKNGLDSQINAAAEGYKADMTRFLRDLVKIPGESCGEKGHVMRIKEEMEKIGFDKVQIDPMGNILGFMGSGQTSHRF